MTTYQFISDPGHGWLRVKLSELKRLGITDKITSYSYISGDHAWLEEDGDYSTFCAAKRAHGEPFTVSERHVNYTTIRDLPCYSFRNND